MRISVIICTHNGAETLGTTLAAIGAQTLKADLFETIVVDDGSSDESSLIARKAGYRVLRCEQSLGLAAARNAGVAASAGDLVVFTDDDCEPARNWLAQLTAPFDDPAVDGVAGLTVTASRASIHFRYLEARNPHRPLPERILTVRTPYQRLVNYLWSEIGPARTLAEGERIYSLVGANMAVRRRHLDAVGGFDGSFDSSSGEEEFCLRLHELLDGASFIFNPSARVAHHYGAGFKDSLRRAQRYGQGNLLIARHNGVLPMLYPIPVLVSVLSAMVIGRRRSASPALLLSPLVAYGRWLTMLPEGGPETLLYPYMQFLQELAFTWGEIRCRLRPDR